MAKPEPIVTLNEEGLRSDLSELVEKTVEYTLNGRLGTINAMESRGAAKVMALEVAEELDGVRFGEAARVVRKGFAETLTYTPPRALVPHPHQQRYRAPKPRDP